MGVYYSPEKVKQVGERIWSGERQPVVVGPYRLIAVLDRGLWKCAPDVTDPKEYAQFYKSYYEGLFISMHVYKVHEKRLKECEQ